MEDARKLARNLEVLTRKGALAALASLRGNELNTGEFASAAGLSDQPAKGLRIAFQENGLVKVTETKIRGATEMRISLTPKGEKAAKLVVEIAKLLSKTD